MNSKITRRDPLEGAPDTQEIMSGARKRSVGTGSRNSHNASKPEKKKATFYLMSNTQKKLKRYAFEIESNQSEVVELAVSEYINNHPI